jgi:hypothetical protein
VSDECYSLHQEYIRSIQGTFPAALEARGSAHISHHKISLDGGRICKSLLSSAPFSNRRDVALLSNGSNSSVTLDMDSEWQQIIRQSFAASAVHLSYLISGSPKIQNSPFRLGCYPCYMHDSFYKVERPLPIYMRTFWYTLVVQISNLTRQRQNIRRDRTHSLAGQLE